LDTNNRNLAVFVFTHRDTLDQLRQRYCKLVERLACVLKLPVSLGKLQRLHVDVTIHSAWRYFSPDQTGTLHCVTISEGKPLQECTHLKCEIPDKQKYSVVMEVTDSFARVGSDNVTLHPNVRDREFGETILANRHVSGVEHVVCSYPISFEVPLWLSCGCNTCKLLRTKRAEQRQQMLDSDPQVH